MWKVECPNCHHLFSVVTEEKDQLIDDEKSDDVKVTVPERIDEALEFINPLADVPMSGSKGKVEKVDDLTYEYRFKCKHCGFEWTEMKEKERVEKGPDGRPIADE